MKKLLSLLVICLTCGYTVFGQVNAHVEYAVYYEEQASYVEFLLLVNGSSLQVKELGKEQIQSEVIVDLTIKQQADSTVVVQEKYLLVGPLSKNPVEFLDLKRYKIESGQYFVEIQLTDALNQKNTSTLYASLNVEPYSADVFMSKIRLLSKITPLKESESSFFKYGYEMQPASYNFFNREMHACYVYAEVYNLNTIPSSKVDVSLVLKDVSKEAKVWIKEKKPLNKLSKEVILKGINLKDISSGNFELIVEIADSSKIYVRDTVFIQRSNPYLDSKMILETGEGPTNSFIESFPEDSLRYALKALSPRLNSRDRATVTQLLLDNDPKAQKYFLFAYWTMYDPNTTEKTFKHYMRIARAVDRKFYSTYGRGFETDMGYIFLKYGQPTNVISVENEPSAVPYEIWFYDKIQKTGQNNVKFLFYNPTLGGYHYELLHSTCRGEIQNERWEQKLYEKAPQEFEGNQVDGTRVKENYNRNAWKYFNEND